ncbi:hypothetical protein NAC44_12015 [Allorhizobium sp. BGMRC 0089]|uniref:putative metallopeptidase n=1 Tax=Allorhizobium sonneratiae TaxID=2934936 RepID=UPI002033D884|nr:putative metallopeptidase [Allorhizobium sonneratiae]MCM2293048.1 hypothetical protein [Allorhizobium sonneratiae]
MIEDVAIRFEPADEIISWARASFIEEDADLMNEDHAHLRSATIGALWTNVPNGRHGRRIIGQAEMGLPPGSKWSRARVEFQLQQWFGCVPDFVLTFDAEYCSVCSDVAFAALVEHELLHCGQARDPYGAPRFRKDGRPSFALRAHDFEGFVSIAARYGIVESGVQELVEALKKKPLFTAEEVGFCCGTCEARKAA